MKIGWTLNVVIMEAELTREQRSPCLQRAAPEQPSKKKLLEIILNSAFAEKPIDESDKICYNITNSGEGRNDQAQFESPLHRVAEGKRGALRCGRRKISLSVFCCYSLESAFWRVFTAAGMPLYGAALYDLDWRFSSEIAFRVGKAVRLCIENKTVAERITRAEAAQLLHAVQTQTLTATSFDTLVAVENLMQWNVNMKNFFYCQPALNYGFAQIDDPAWQLPMDHPDCRATKQELINIMEFWLSLGADGFRVDMASSLIKNDPDGSGIRAFWQEIRQMFDEKHPECVLISEWSYPTKAIAAGFHMDFLIHFNLPAYTKLFRAEPGRNVSDQFGGHSFFQKDGNGSLDDFLTDYLREYDATKGKGYISIPTGNHDMPRISVQRTKRELEVVYAFLMTMPSVPFVYYGDEIGLPYRADLPSKEGGFNRTGARTPMQWADGKNAGFSEADADKLYLPVDEHGVNVAEQLADENSLLHTMQKLIALRKSSPALCADGEIEFVNRRHNGYPLVYRRWLGSEEYLVCINPLDVLEVYAVGDGWKTALANQTVRIENGQLTLEPFGYVILKMARNPA